MRYQIAAANWKMNLKLGQGEELVKNILNKNIALGNGQQVIFCPAFPYLLPIGDLVKTKAEYYIGAQNAAAEAEGAYTGEVSAQMLSSVHSSYVIIGHSERRKYFSEDHPTLAKKVDQALMNGLKPIFCCGEPLGVRDAGNQETYVEGQLMGSLLHVSKTQILNCVIAYEPVWAIGTGHSATPEQAQQMHAFIRSVLTKKYDKDTAHAISIIYGGSVNGSNAKSILQQPDVDGALVGGASLDADEFTTIIQSLKANA